MTGRRTLQAAGNTCIRRAVVWRAAAIAAFLLLVPLVGGVAQGRTLPPGTIVGVTPKGRVSEPTIREKAEPLFESWGVPALPRDVDVFTISYISRDFDGSQARVLAQLFVPVMDAAAEVQKRPLLVFGSGTTGVGDQCAPSLEQPLVRRWGHYRANMMSYASQGIIAIFPDYLGFNDPDRPQRYFSKNAEAHAMLDAARAVQTFLRQPGTYTAGSRAVGPWPTGFDHLFASGYSQGGHAAFAAADLWKEYAPELPFTGVIGFAATTNIEVLFREGPYYAPSVVYNYLDMYGADEIVPDRYFQERWATTLESDVPELCVDEFQLYYPFDGTQLYTAEFYDALYQGGLEEEFPGLARRLEENATGLSGHGVPALMIQGNEDIIITTPSQTRFVAALQSRGSDVEYLTMDGVRHRHTRPAGFRDSVRWIKERSGLSSEISHLD